MGNNSLYLELMLDNQFFISLGIINKIMIRKGINALLLVSILGLLLFGNLTQSRTYQRINNNEKELLSLNLSGSDFLFEKSAKEFDVIEHSFYSYSKFRYLIMILCGLSVIVFFIQVIDKSKLTTPISYSIFAIIAFFILGYFTDYPNFYYELSTSKFQEMPQTIHSSTPAVHILIYLIFGGLILHWSLFFINKKPRNLLVKS